MVLVFNKLKMEEQINTQPGIEQKKSKWLIWLIVGIVIIGIGTGIYFLLTRDSSSLFNAGSSIPSPPALPN